MARLNDLMQGAKIILDNLYTTDEDLEYIIDMALKKVSTDAPILIKELKIDEPPEIVNFGLTQNCIEDETIDCCNNNNSGGSNTDCYDDTITNKTYIGGVTIHQDAKIPYVITSTGHSYISILNNTGSDLHVIRKNGRDVNETLRNSSYVFAHEIVIDGNHPNENMLDIELIEVNSNFSKYPINIYGSFFTPQYNGTPAFDFKIKNTNNRNAYMHIYHQAGRNIIADKVSIEKHGSTTPYATQYLSAFIIEPDQGQ